MTRKFNFLHQMPPIYYLPVVSLALTCGRENSTPIVVIKGTTTTETVFQKPATQGSGPATATKGNGPGSSSSSAQGSGSGSSSSSITSLPPAAPSGGPGSSSSSAKQGSRSGSSSSSITSLPPAPPSGGPGSSSLSTATQNRGKVPSSSSSSPSSSAASVQDKALVTGTPTSQPGQPSREKREAITALKDKIREVVANVSNKVNQDNKIDNEILIIEDKNKKDVPKEKDTWYTGIQWKDHNKWNDWVINPNPTTTPSDLVQGKASDIRLAYFNKVNEFLKIHLKETQPTQFNFEELQGEINQAKEEIVKLKTEFETFQSDTQSQQIVQKAQASLKEYEDKLTKVKTGLSSDYFVAAEAFHQRCRVVFNSVLDEIKKKKLKRNFTDNNKKMEIDILEKILAQLPSPEEKQD